MYTSAYQSGNLQDGAESCYQVALRPGEGFCPDPDEMRVLDGIDSRLKELLPPEEFEEVSARPSQMVSLPSTQKSFNESEVIFIYYSELHVVCRRKHGQGQRENDMCFTLCCEMWMYNIYCLHIDPCMGSTCTSNLLLQLFTMYKSNMMDLIEIYGTFIHMYCYLHEILFLNMVTITWFSLCKVLFHSHSSTIKNFSHQWGLRTPVLNTLGSELYWRTKNRGR